MVKTMPNYPSDRMAKRPKTIKIMSFLARKRNYAQLPSQPKGQKAKRPKGQKLLFILLKKISELVMKIQFLTNYYVTDGTRCRWS